MLDFLRLMIIFIILALLLLLAILGTIAYLCARKKIKKQKIAKSTNAGYSTLNQSKSAGNGENSSLLIHEQGSYSTPDFGYGRGGAFAVDRYGYRNNAYGGGGGSGDGDRYAGRYGYGDGALVPAAPPPLPRRGSRESVSSGGDGSVGRHGVHEKFEETYKQEIVYEKAASTDSKEML